MTARPSLLILLALALAAVPARAQRNVLLLIGDDLGVERVGAYGEHAFPGHTPNLDCLAARGVLFRNAWSHPLCSPTRAAILTGRHPFRTGIGDVIQGGDAHALDPAEWPLPRLIRLASGGRYRSAALGKWHLASLSQGAPLHPLACGFDVHAGSLFNLPDYFHWSKSVQGEARPADVYATSDTANDALRAAAELPEPWFLWVAFNAPHKPLHAPPDELHSFALPPNPSDDPPLFAKAMIEAMDGEIGRLLAGIPPDVLARTDVIFIGDNGTLGLASDGPFPPNHAKGTLYEGGINVPLIIAGPDVTAPGSECDALVQASDLYATIAELCGVDVAAWVPSEHVLDSVSLAPYLADPTLPSRRGSVFAERFEPNGFGPNHLFHKRALRGPRFKLIHDEITGADELYDLESDPLEATNLLGAPLTPEARAAYERLAARLAALCGE